MNSYCPTCANLLLRKDHSFGSVGVLMYTLGSDDVCSSKTHQPIFAVQANSSLALQLNLTSQT